MRDLQADGQADQGDHDQTPKRSEEGSEQRHARQSDRQMLDYIHSGFT